METINIKSNEDLIKDLSKVIADYSDDKEVQNGMAKIYNQKNLPPHTVGMIFKEKYSLTDLEEIELWIWCYYLYELTHEKIIKPEDSISEGSIYQAIHFIDDNETEKRIDKIILEGTKRIITNDSKIQYVCPYLSYYDLYKINQSRLLCYNFDTQRKAKMTAYKKRVIKQPSVNKVSVEQISDIIAADKFTSNLLTFNIRRDSILDTEDENVYFQEYSFMPGSNLGTLTITPDEKKGIFVDNIDGYHRSKAITKAISKANKIGKELHGGFAISVTNFGIDDANDYIEREDKRNAMNKELIKSISKNDTNMITGKINSLNEDNMMYEKVVKTLDELEKYNSLKVYEQYKYTTVGILSEGFKLSNLKFKNVDKNKRYIQHFINIFNIIIGHCLEVYDDDIEQVFENSVMLQPNIFVGYVSIGVNLLNVENNEQILKNILKTNKINFNRNEQVWKDLALFDKNIRSYKKIYDYFENLIKEELK